MVKSIEIIALIFRSVDYLEFITEQLKSDLCKVEGWDVGIRVIANDATNAVLSALPATEMPFTIYNDPNPSEYYINRVYRCHNHGVMTSDYSNICFVNSDILFSKNWLDNLLKHHDGNNIPCCQLVESGKMPSASHGISCNFGTHPKNINYSEWDKFSQKIQRPIILEGGLLGPVIFEKERFIEAGMYPEGNIYHDGVGTCNGDVLNTSDVYFFNEILATKFGMRHITVCDSVCYHIQEGEKDE